MEMKTVQIINNICKLDKDVQGIVLLKINEAISWLYDNIEDDAELEACLDRIVKRNGTDGINSGAILKYCGFTPDDDNADEIIDEYYSSSNPNRMEILKKRLIESALELEELEEGD